QEAEDLEVEPDEGDQQAEGPVPLHVLRGPAPGAVLDEVEVEDEVHGGEPNNEDAEGDPEGPAVVDEGDALAEEPEPHRDHVEQGDAAGGGHDPELEVLARADEAGAVGGEEGGQAAEGEADRVHDDAGIAELVEPGDPTQEQTLEGRVERGGDRGEGRLERGDQRD